MPKIGAPRIVCFLSNFVQPIENASNIQMGSLLTLVRSCKHQCPVALFVWAFIARWNYMIDLEIVGAKVHLVTGNEAGAGLALPQPFSQDLRSSGESLCKANDDI